MFAWAAMPLRLPKASIRCSTSDSSPKLRNERALSAPGPRSDIRRSQINSTPLDCCSRQLRLRKSRPPRPVETVADPHGALASSRPKTAGTPELAANEAVAVGSRARLTQPPE